MTSEKTGQAELRKGLDGLESLPTLPGIALELIKTALRPTGTAEDLARIVEMDPAAATRALELANRDLPGTAGPVTSIRGALETIGVAAARGLALSPVPLDLFSDRRAEYGLDLPALWEHSLGTALLARRIATAAAVEVNSEEAYVAGLLHDIGKVPLALHAGAGYRKILTSAAKEKVPLYRVEGERLGCDHAEAGIRLLERWGLPEIYRVVVRHHHRPTGVLLDEPYPLALARIVHAADRFCYLDGLGDGGAPGPHRPPSAELLRGIGLSEEALGKIRGEIVGEMEERQQRIPVPFPSLERFFPLLAEANRTLGKMREEQEQRHRGLRLRQRELAGINALGLHLQGCRSLQEALRYISETLVSAFPFREAVTTLYLDEGRELNALARKGPGEERPPAHLFERPRRLEPYEVQDPAEGPWLFVDLIGKKGPLGHLKVQPDPIGPLPLEQLGLLLASCAKLATEALERIQSHHRVRRLAEGLERTVHRLDEEKEKAEREKIEKQSILESIPVGLFLLDEKGRLRCHNPAAARMLPAEFLEAGRPLMECFSDPAVLEAGRRALETPGEGRPLRGETTLPGTDGGGKRTYQWGIVPLWERGNGEKALLFLLDDVTEERDLQRQLVESARMASIGQLAAGTAHNLRSPLGALKGIVELLLEEIEEGRIACYKTDAERSRPTRTVKEQLQIVLKSLEKSFSIIDDLLQFSRRPDRPPERLRLGELLEGTESLLGELFKERGIRIEKSLAYDEVFGRRADLMQVFLNLYSNAYKAMPEGGVLRITSRPVSRGPSNVPFIEIVVSDTGQGIPTEHLPKIFDPFFSTSDRVEGTGLGLSLTRKMIQEHGGRIEVSSTVGEGTTFRILLPAHPDGLSWTPGESA